jgi:hypothetical protein
MMFNKYIIVDAETGYVLTKPAVMNTVKVIRPYFTFPTKIEFFDKDFEEAVEANERKFGF